MSTDVPPFYADEIVLCPREETMTSECLRMLRIVLSENGGQDTRVQ